MKATLAGPGCALNAFLFSSYLCRAPGMTQNSIRIGPKSLSRSFFGACRPLPLAHAYSDRWSHTKNNAPSKAAFSKQTVSKSEIIPDPVLPREVPERQKSSAAVPFDQLFSLANRTILITGGGRGIGLSIAGAIVDAGGHVACTDILEAPAEEEWAALQAKARKQGVEATYHACDTTDEEAVNATVAKVSRRCKELNAPLSGALTSAGIIQKLDALDVPLADFEKIFRVNTGGTFVSVKAVARDMVENGIEGSIVMIASMSGTITNRGLKCASYNASKAAVHQLCRSMAYELSPTHGIRINTLSPGYIRTKMTDQLLRDEPELKKTWMAGALLNRFGAPEDFHGPAVFLLSHASSFMTGGDLRVDGGHTASA